jgi:hypothetical protein
MWAHNGLWTAQSPYRKTFPFAEDEAVGPPQGPELWQHLFAVNKEWGLSTIKQDHITQQIHATKSAFTNVSVLKSWMSGLGEGAAENGVGVLYCCAEPNIHMNGVTVPAAYAVRASPDYVGSGATLRLPTIQWAIGPDAAFHWNGLGLLPYKDTFISNATSSQRSGRSWSPTDSANWPSFSGYHESGAATHALMSLLSMAHVTVGDAVGETNATLVRQLIRADGRLLKADRPATAIDAQFQAMLFGAWPGADPGPGAVSGSLFTMPCDKQNEGQQWSYVCAPGDKTRCALKLAGAGADEGCLVSGAGAGCAAPAADIGAGIVVHDAGAGQVACAANASCTGQNWLLAKNDAGPRGSAQYAIQARRNSSATGKPMCLELRDGGAKLAACDPTVAGQGWLARPGASAFVLQTTWHDDATCLTAARPWQGSSGGGGGAFRGFRDGAAGREALADELFPRPAGGGIAAEADRHKLTDQYRESYTISAALLRQIDKRNAVQCPRGGLGAPQGPLGEIYSTHTTVGGLTWRYVVGVQLSARHNVTAHDLAMPHHPAAAAAAAAAAMHVSYRYDEAAPGFEPLAAADLRPVAADGTVLELQASSADMCTVYPGGGAAGDARVQVRCFPFELHAVAPLASNGWVLTGETGKFIPISAQRISSVMALPGGGFDLGLLGAPNETVRMGAADVRGRTAPVYAEAIIGADGTARLKLL